MVTVSATIALGQNGYTTTDISAANVEYIIDAAIDYINALAGSGIPNLSGAAGTMSATISNLENAALSPLVSIMLRETKKTSLSNSSATSGSSSTSSSIQAGSLGVSESSSVGSAISAASALNNAGNSPIVGFFEKALEKLKEEVSGELEAELA